MIGPLLCALAIVAPLLEPPTPDQELTTRGNPVLNGADPHAAVIDGTLWMYPTSGRTQFFAYSSDDLRRWGRHGPVLRFEDVAWIDDDGADRHYAWAPCLAVKDGKHYFYYSVGPQGPTPSRIGVAVGDSPAGPFADSGRPLLTGGEGFEAIDPMVYTDPKTGVSYLYAGGSAGSKLRVFELGADMTSFAREIPVQTPPKFTEGPFVHEHGGVYYLSYSSGSWRTESYSVHYATSESPLGPWTYRGPLLVSNDRHKGPGHHSIVRWPPIGEWLIVYHRWNDRTGPGPYKGARQIAIERLEHRPDRSLAPVVMTDDPPAPADAP